MPKTKTGTFFDIDPEGWEEYVDLPDNRGSSTRTSKKVKKNRLPDVDPTPYWESLASLVDAWADYQKVKKLLINVSFDETEHSVRPVVDGYWGDVDKLEQAVDERSSLVDVALRCHKLLCARFGVEAIDREWLYHSLRESRDYASYRGKISRRMARNKPPQSMEDL